MGPIFGGSNKQQIYGNFFRISLIIVHYSGWCHIMTTVNTPSDRASVFMDLCMFCLVSFCFSKSLSIGIWIVFVVYAMNIYIYV